MKKAVPALLFAVIGVAIYFTIHQSKRPAKTVADIVSVKSEDEENEADEQDGILLAQQMEFEMTKDIKLGYVPKYRLIEAHENLVQQRRANPSARLQGASAFTWAERGPFSDTIGPAGNGRVSANQVTSGRMRTIWVDLADPTNKTVWVGGIDGGIWKTSDIVADPSAWSLVTDFTSNIAIASICQSPVNTNIMYFGTGEKTLNADAVRGGGIWKSTDHGVTWNLLPASTSFGNVSKVVCDPVNAGIVYVATMGASFTGNTSGILRSADGGTTWTNITPTGLNTAVTEMELSSAGRLHIVCGYYNGYFNANPSGYRFTDNPATVTPATWTTPATTFTSTAYNVDITTAGDVLYALPANAAYQTPQVWRSTDGGNNWIAVAGVLPFSGNTGISSGQAWYNLAIGVDPTDAGRVMIGGLNSYITADSGTTWTKNSVWATGITGSANYIHADHHTIVWNNNQVLDGGDGGIFYSGNDGTTFSDRNVGLRIKQFYAVAIHPTSTNYLLAGAQDNGCHQLNGPGLTSSVEVTGGDGAFMHIDQDEPQYQFGSYVFSNYRRSTNGGATWSSVDFGDVGQFINPTDYDDVANKLYGGWTAGIYHRWDNAPTSNTNVPVGVAAFNGASVTHVKVSPYTSNRVFFGTNGGRVVRVDNAHLATPAGTNITGSTMPANQTVSCVATGTTDNNLLATYSNYGLATNRLWVSTTGGGPAGWINVTGNFPDIPVRWAMFYPEDNTKAILGTELGIYTTDLINGASTVWVQDAGFPMVRVDMLQYRPKDGLVAVATHGRGVWTTTIPLTVPYVRFAFNNNSRTEATQTTSGGRNYTDYTAVMNIDVAPAGNATVTLTPGTGTATQGVDYDFTTNGNFTTPSNVVSFASGSTTSQNVTVRIYNDAEVESTESFVLNYAISGSTNAVAAPSSTAYTFTIADNDVTPIAGGLGTTTIGTGNFGGFLQPLRSNFNDSRSQYIYLASELTAAGIVPGNINALALNVLSKTSTQPYNGFTISIKNTTTSSFAAFTFETGTTVFYTGNYTPVAGINTFNPTGPAFSWDGTSNVLVQFCFDNNSATGAGDSVSTNITTPLMGIYNRDNTAGASGCTLPAGNFSAGVNTRPDITFSATLSGNPIATALGTNRTEYIGSNGLFHFYSGINILNSISGASANLGSVSSTITQAGNTWQSFQSGERSQKVFDIAPTTNTGASYTIGLYFTNDELGGKTPNTLKIAKTTAATLAEANISNTIIANSTPVAYGSGWLYTASFTGFSKFFLVDVNVSLPVTLLDFAGKLNSNGIVLDWNTSSEQKSKHFVVEKSADGITFSQLATVGAAGNSSVKRSYSYVDKKVYEYNYYRLKMVDLDSKFIYSNTVLIVSRDVKQAVQVVNNPFQSYIDLRFAKLPKQTVQAELLTISGAKLFTRTYGAASQVRLNLAAVNISSGTYLLRVVADGEQYVSKVIKQ